MRKSFASEEAARAYIAANTVLARTYDCQVVMGPDCRFAIALIKGGRFFGILSENDLLIRSTKEVT